MTFKPLTTTYLETNHIDSLRYELCDIIYEDYKGVIFSLDELLIQKKKALKNISIFLEKHPEISQHKEESAYWYPYKKVDSSADLNIYSHCYPNIDNEITELSIERENNDLKSDYLFDPVKIQFFLMARDITKMDNSYDTATEIRDINSQIFKILLDTVGDTVSYNGLNTLQHIRRYIQNSIDQEKEAELNTEYNEFLKEHIIRGYQAFNSQAHLVIDTIIMCEHYQLEKKLSHNKENIKTIKI